MNKVDFVMFNSYTLQRLYIIPRNNKMLRLKLLLKSVVLKCTLQRQHIEIPSNNLT
jgi:hypothetical protein